MFYSPKLAKQPILGVASLAATETMPTAAVRNAVSLQTPALCRTPSTLLLSILLHTGLVGLLTVALPSVPHSAPPPSELDTVLLLAPLESLRLIPLVESPSLPAPESAFPEWYVPVDDILESSLSISEEPFDLKAPDLALEAETLTLPVLAQWDAVRLPVAPKPTPATTGVALASAHGGGGGGAGPAVIGTGGVASSSEQGGGVGTGTGRGAGTGSGAGTGRGTGYGAGTGTGVGDGPALRQPRAGGATKGASILSTLSPAYPDAQRRAGRTAVVLLEVLINETGQALEFRVLSGGEIKDFAAAALKEARKARYAPALEDGHAVPGYVRIKVEFRLK